VLFVMPFIMSTSTRHYQPPRPTPASELQYDCDPALIVFPSSNRCQPPHASLTPMSLPLTPLSLLAIFRAVFLCHSLQFFCSTAWLYVTLDPIDRLRRGASVTYHGLFFASFIHNDGVRSAPRSVHCLQLAVPRM
jgi:hypothetical protein